MTKDALYYENVIEWISSLSGFQGGNPESEIWFCGLEYQGLNIEEKVKDRFSSVDKPPFLEKKDIEDGDHHKERFNQNLVKLANAFYETVPKIDVKDAFLENGKVFKLNLYPLPQSRTGEVYSQEIYDKTGIITKSELRSICLNNGLPNTPSRFDNFKDLLKKHEKTVKVIVCCSTGAIDNFLLAFAGKSNFYELKEQMLDRDDVEKKENIVLPGKNKRNKYFYWCKFDLVDLDNVYLFVIPFLSGSASCLNSNDELEFMGKKIREIVNQT